MLARHGRTCNGPEPIRRQDPLETLLLDKFRAATTPAMLDALVRLVSQRVDAAARARDAQVETCKAEILRPEA